MRTLLKILEALQKLLKECTTIYMYMPINLFKHALYIFINVYAVTSSPSAPDPEGICPPQGACAAT